MQQEQKQDAFERDDAIIGRNSVLEALKSGRIIDSVMVARGERSGSIAKILAMCKEQGIVIKEVDARKLQAVSANGNHQGVIALCAAHAYATVEDILKRAEERNEPPFLLVCDEIEDSHNLGAMIRTAEAAGVHGVIIPKRRNVGLNFIVAKTASGALEYVPVARVGNLAATLEQLKEKGLWIYGADMEGETWCETDLTGPMALVIGSEGKGIGRLVKERCDFLLSLPMHGRINSLNASVAAGILMYEAARQRKRIPAK